MVSGFHPDTPIDDHREAARGLVRDLERADSDAMPRPWGALSSLLTGALSLGAVPIMLWQDRFRDFVDAERQQLRRFAEWLRLHSSRPETMDLRVAGEDLGTRPVLSALSMLSVLGVMVLFAAQLGGSGALLDRILDNTYRFDPSARPWRWPIDDPQQQLFVAWSVGLSVAYLFHWVQVQAHVSDVRRVVNHANRVFRGMGVPRVPEPRIGIGLALLWLAAGALLARYGAWWGLAMAVAGAAQQRYMASHSLRLRRALAARVRGLAHMPITPGTVTAAEAVDANTLFAASAKRCPHVRCLSTMPAGARFCPRCGHNVQA